MKKKLFILLGIILMLIAATQVSSVRVDSVVPIIISAVSGIGAMLCFGASGILDEGEDD